MRVRIDTSRCQGHGRCYDLAPDVFGEDEDGYSTLLTDGLVPEGSEESVQLAVANCPETALSVVEGA